MTSRRGPNSSNRNPFRTSSLTRLRGKKLSCRRPFRMRRLNCRKRQSRRINPRRKQLRRCPRRRRHHGRGPLPRKSPPGIAELPSRSSNTKAIRLLPARGTRPAPHNSPSRSIATERSLRTASCGRRDLPHSIRKQSTPCGVRSPSRPRRRTCPVKRSISPCPFDSTFARPKGDQT